MNARVERRHFVIGLISIIVAIAILVVTAIVAEPYFFSPKIMTETYFTDSINGLEVGRPVKFRGVPIGQITKIGLTSELYPQDHIGTFEERESLAVVRMLLYFDKTLFTEQLPKYIAQGLRAQTQLEGLTGTQYIALDFLEPSHYQVRRHPYPWEPAYPVIPSAPSLTNEILDSSEKFLAGLSDMHLDSSFKDTLPAIQAVILQLDRVIAGLTGDTANKVLGNIDSFLKTADNKVEDVNVKQINDLIKSFNGSAENISKLASDQQTQKLVDEINALSAKFNNMATGNEYSVRQLMSSLAQVTLGLADLTRELNNNPGFFFTRRAPTRLLKD